jgi:subtilase family serine protease
MRTNRPHLRHQRLDRGLAFATTFLLVVLSFAPEAQAAPRQMLHDNLPDVPGQPAPLRRTDPSTRLDLAIGLPIRNQAALTALLNNLYNPASPDYRHFLTPQQFAERFGPTPQDYQALSAFILTNGLRVTNTHPNRLILDVEGSVPDIEKVFHVTMHDYQHPTEKRIFYAPDVEPSLDLAVPVQHISGLDNYERPHPNLAIRKAPKSKATPQSGAGPSGTYAGNDFRAAYVPGIALTGTGQSIGLLEFDGYYASDIAAYDTQFGLPNVPLVNVAVDGGVSTPGDDNDEVSLDIEMANAMAQGASTIYVYEAPNTTGQWDDLLSKMADDNVAKQLSSSWSGGSRANSTAETIFKQMASQGQSFFNSSGDSDAYTGTIPFPCDSPSITVVGGTTLTTSGAGGSFTSETAWNWGLDSDTSTYVGTSGGISTHYSIPSYQQGVSMASNQGSTTMRDVPDVAMTADNVYIKYNNGSSETVGGTSCAAPLWAGFMALVNQQAVTNGQSTIGFLNPTLYTIGESSSYTSNFHDTTTGNNFSSSSPSKFAATTNYDLCTGLGTPAGATLLYTLAGLPPPVISSAATTTGTVNVSFNYQITASHSPTSYAISVLPAGLGINSTTGLISGTPTTGGVTSATISASNADGTGSAPLTITIQQAPAITNGPPPATVLINASSSFSYTATGYPAPTFSSSGLPTGLTLSSAGVISGSPTVTGVYTGTVTASNGVSPNATQNFSITVQQDPAITSNPLPATISSGMSYNFDLTASGYPAPTFSVTAGALPTGLTLSSNGVLSGTPTAVGTFTGTITASNAAGVATQNFSITIPAPASDTPAMPSSALMILGLLLVLAAGWRTMPRGAKFPA